MTPSKKFGAALVALASIMSSNAAQAACWSPAEVEAAQVRDLDAMLMVGSLRCKASDQGFVAEYNSFVSTSRPALMEANDRLRDHFDTAGGLKAYDQYVTALANQYGDGTLGASCANMRSLLKSAKVEGETVFGLANVAQSVAVQPRLPGLRCASAVTAAR